MFLTYFLDCQVLIWISVLYHYNILILKTSSIDIAYLLHLWNNVLQVRAKISVTVYIYIVSA